MPISHKIGAVLALVPFFFGLFLARVAYVEGDSSSSIDAMVMQWWLMALGIYAAVRLAGFIISGRL